MSNICTQVFGFFWGTESDVIYKTCHHERVFCGRNLDFQLVYDCVGVRFIKHPPYLLPPPSPCVVGAKVKTDLVNRV